MTTPSGRFTLTLALALALVLAATATINAAPPPLIAGTSAPAADEDTIAHYPFEDSANDALGDHDGVLYGDAAFAPGIVGQALQVGGTGDYVRLGNVHESPPRSSAQGWVEMWVKLEYNPNDHFALIVSGSEYGDEYDDGFFLGKHTYFSDNLVFMIWAGLGPGWQVADSGIHADEFVDQWRHVRGTWGPRGVEIWVDQILRDTYDYTGELFLNYQAIHIGTNSWKWDAAALIDEVRIGDVQPALPPSQFIYMPLLLR
jgi:hypothetical protein